MNFFSGSIFDAVSLSKSKNSIFVVFVKGNDKGSVKLSEMLDTASVRSKLQSNEFVVIQISSNEESYIQFAAIYQVVPIPSIFFIGKNGTPLEIVTDIIKSSEELEAKIENALKIHKDGNEKSASVATASSAASASPPPNSNNTDCSNSIHNNICKISHQTSNSSTTPPPNSEATAPATAPETASNDCVDTDEDSVKNVKGAAQPIIVEKNESVSFAVSSPLASSTSSAAAASLNTANSSANVAKIVANHLNNNNNRTTTTTNNNNNNVIGHSVAGKSANTGKVITPISVEEKNNEEAKERMRKLLEQKRKERAKEEQKLEMERELKRRADAKAAQNVHEWQKNNELKELKQNIKREKLAEQEARERIRAQIQADRAERAQKNKPMSSSNDPSSSHSSQQQAAAQQQAKKKPAVTSDETKLQFRLPSGDNHMNVFKITQTLGEVRSYVQTNLLANSGIRNFYLATSYPRQEYDTTDDVKTLAELGLMPNGVILVIAKENKMSPSGIISRSGGFINIFTTFLRLLMSPFVSAYDYVQSMFRKRPADATNDNVKRSRLAGQFDNNAGASTSDAGTSTDDKRPKERGSSSKAYRRHGGSNIHRLSDNRKNSDDENATWNGNSTQQQ